MTWLLIGTGFSGALTFLFLLKKISHIFVTPKAISVHFSPAGGCSDALVNEINKARHEILIQAYSFTSKQISQALVEAKKRRIKLDIILDGSNEREQYTELHFLMENGIHPVIDSHHPIAHNKIMIFDSKTIATGSFNFTHQAEQNNAENLLILKGHPELVALYKKNFAIHKEHSRVAQVNPEGNPGQARHNMFGHNNQNHKSQAA
ncbi:phospholipase D family protein [bacterium]|jgi:phosphatidylserine/phosphatidylglycerophosphate/cardiolipin synthase-like enzyme|nr:phospholipase D family protein [bacterium]